MFSGFAIASLYSDPHLMSKSGSVVIAAGAALEYGFKDFNGKRPNSFREERDAATRGHTFLLVGYQFCPRHRLGAIQGGIRF
jgi:hypothetical protein